jgi:asparagine N-glycosylation enzyme membrane subunit Stt3
LPLLTLIGLLITLRDRRARVTIVLLVAIVLQAVTLFVLAKSQGADTPYMAFKMVYLAIYPAAVLAAVAMASAERAVVTGSREHSESKGESKNAVGWILAAVLMIAAVRPALSATRAVPVVDLDFYAAGKWTRANIGQTCVDYLVGDAETAYWLHLAVLGNPRVSERTIEMDRYEPRAAIGPWITSEGRSYAIADQRLLPDEVRSRVEIVSTFGNAAVIKRSGVMMGDCDLGR